MVSSSMKAKDKLKVIRRLSSKSQLWVAVEMGVEERTYRRWENGENKISMDNFEKAINLMGYKIEVVDDK